MYGDGFYMPCIGFLRNCEIVRNRDFAKFLDCETAKPPVRGFAFAAVSLSRIVFITLLWGYLITYRA